MRKPHIRTTVFLFLIALLFLNKNETLNIYYWIFSFLMYGVFIMDFNGEYFFLKKNIYGNRNIILTFFGFISLLWAPNFDVSIVSATTLLAVVLNSYVLCYFIIKYNLVNQILITVLLYSFINYTLIFNLPVFKFLQNVDEEGLQRFVGTELNPNDLGIMLNFSIFLSLWMLNTMRQVNYLQIIHVVNISLGVYTIILSQSRTAMICAGLLIFIFILLKGVNFIFSIKTLIFGALAVLVCIFFWNYLLENIIPSFERFGGMLSTFQGLNADNSTAVRLSYFKNGWEQFTANPWVGYGINSFRYFYHQYSHNNYIELLFGFGFLGPVIYYSMHVFIIKKIIKYRKGAIIVAFTLVLFIMDSGTVTFYSKSHMLIFITLIIFSETIIKSKFLETAENKSYNSFPIAQ